MVTVENTASFNIPHFEDSSRRGHCNNVKQTVATVSCDTHAILAISSRVSIAFADFCKPVFVRFLTNRSTCFTSVYWTFWRNLRNVCSCSLIIFSHLLLCKPCVFYYLRFRFYENDTAVGLHFCILLGTPLSLVEFVY